MSVGMVPLSPSIVGMHILGYFGILGNHSAVKVLRNLAKFHVAGILSRTKCSSNQQNKKTANGSLRLFLRFLYTAMIRFSPGTSNTNTNWRSRRKEPRVASTEGKPLPVSGTH
jgi:hypothetical protein